MGDRAVYAVRELVVGGEADYGANSVLIDAYLFQRQRGSSDALDRASRPLIEKAEMRMEWSTEKPECIQLMRLVARCALISSFFRNPHFHCLVVEVCPYPPSTISSGCRSTSVEWSSSFP